MRPTHMAMAMVNKARRRRPSMAAVLCVSESSSSSTSEEEEFLSNYEKQRLENIKENQQMLKMLG